MRIVVLLLFLVAGLVVHAGLRFTDTVHGVNAAGTVSSPTTITISAMVRIDAGATPLDWIAGVRFGAAPEFLGLTLFATNVVGCNGQVVIKYTNSVPTNEWHHVAVSASSGWSVLYWDGTAVATNSGTWTTSSSSVSVEIGGVEFSGTVYDAFTGDLAEVCMWDRSLTSGEIRGLATGRSPVGLISSAFYYDAMTSTNGWNLLRSPRTAWRSGVIPSATNTHPKTFKP